MAQGRCYRAIANGFFYAIGRPEFSLGLIYTRYFFRSYLVWWADYVLINGFNRGVSSP